MSQNIYVSSCHYLLVNPFVQRQKFFRQDGVITFINDKNAEGTKFI